jgi:integrase
MKLSIQLKAKSPEDYYVYIGLSHKTSRVLISTPYIISATHVKNGKITNRAKYAEIYNNELLKYEEKLAHIVAPDKLDIKVLKDILTAKTHSENEIVEFFSSADKILARREKKKPDSRTEKIYRYAVGTFQKYIGREMYTFEITSKVIQGYIDFLQFNGKTAKTIISYIAILKYVFNIIKDEYNDYDLGIIVVKNDPFRKLQLPQHTGNTGAKALTIEELRRIIHTPFAKGEGYNLSNIELARDYFLLSFYMLGINPVDMFNLRKSQLKNGWLTYSRRKTQRRAGGSEISIPISDKAMEIINRHSGRGEFLLDMQDKYSSVENCVHMVSNKFYFIHSICDIQIDKKYFTWYSARHTWASIAANECHFSDAEVARALNHQSTHKVTRGYIRPDWSLLERMNNAVLSVIFG